MVALMSENLKYNYSPPFVQKKRFPQNTSSSYRVFFEDAYNWPSKPDSDVRKVPDYFTPIVTKIPDTQTSLYPKRDLRHNNPQPQHCKFMLNNARTLNDPMCFVKTHNVDDANDENWFNYSSLPVEHTEAKYTADSISRSDYLNWKNNIINTRHSHNPNIKQVTNNIISDSRKGSGEKRYWNEGLSFEHQYNCRLDTNYPVRGKRHGAFVWSRNNSHVSSITENRANDKFPASAPQDSTEEFQHKLACHRQFAKSRFLLENVDSVSRLIRPDVDSNCRDKQSPLIFTH